MGYKIQTTNTPEDSDLIEVDEHEFIDLQRMGLIRPNKGDVNASGKLKRTVDAPDEVKNATGSQPVVQNGAQ